MEEAQEAYMHELERAAHVIWTALQSAELLWWGLQGRVIIYHLLFITHQLQIPSSLDFLVPAWLKWKCQLKNANIANKWGEKRSASISSVQIITVYNRLCKYDHRNHALQAGMICCATLAWFDEVDQVWCSNDANLLTSRDVWREKTCCVVTSMWQI